MTPDVLAQKIADQSARVGVLMGGMSSERQVSLKSGKAVKQALVDRGWDAVAIDVGPDLPARLREERIDVAWLALHGAFGEDGAVQGLLEVMRIPYTGSGVQASAIAIHKTTTKRLLDGKGVRLPADVSWSPGDPLPTLPLPLICKTPRGGSTLGILKAHTEQELQTALDQLGALDASVLVEQIIEGEEATCAVLDGRPLPVTLIRPVDQYFDFEAKYTEGKTEYLTPAPLPEAVLADIQAQSKAAYEALGLRGVARADYMVDKQGKAWFLEINTLPGMTATSLSPMAAAADGMDFGSLVEHLLRSATLELRPADGSEQWVPGAPAAP